MLDCCSRKTFWSSEIPSAKATTIYKLNFFGSECNVAEIITKQFHFLAKSYSRITRAKARLAAVTNFNKIDCVLYPSRLWSDMHDRLTHGHEYGAVLIHVPQEQQVIWFYCLEACSAY